MKSFRTYTMVFALIAIWIFFSAQTGGAFLQARNISNLLRQMAVTGILSAGMVLIIVSRQIDLSVGSVVAFLGAVLAVLNTNYMLSPTTSLGIAILVGATIGLLQGFLTSYQKIPAFIVTLGGMMVFRGATMWITKNATIPLQEGWLMGLGTQYLSAKLGWIIVGTVLLIATLTTIRKYQLSKKYDFRVSTSQLVLMLMMQAALIIGFMAVLGSYQGVPIPVLIMLSLMLIIHFAATRTVWGRHLYAIGGNVDAAFVSGINVRARVLSAFLLMGVLSAVAGAVLTARVGSASPDAGQLLELDAIASCVIGGTSLLGGKGSVLGAILGALVMESLNNGMSMANIEPYWQFIVKGCVLVLAVWVDIFSQSTST